MNVDVLEREAFLARLHAGESDDDGRQRKQGAFLLGFDFVPAPSRRAGLPTMQEVLEEEVAGFYDRRADRIFVPRVRPANTDQALVQRAVLAHEIQHALQAQHFERRGEPETSDENLAHLALVEGDAQVAMAAWLGTELGAPVGRTLRRIRETIQRVPQGALHRSEKAIDRTLDLVRERLSFPYEEGMFFVTDLVRAGGFALVDLAFTRPPRATEHILHPQKYLFDEQPRTIAPLEPPRGMAVLGRDTLGELQIRVLLSRCHGRTIAESAAAGWAGDAFTLLSTGDGRLVVAWVTAWDTERDAQEAEGVLVSSARCFGDNELGDLRIDGRTKTRRKKDVVAFVRGADEALSGTLLEALLDLPGKAPAPAPVSDRIIPPRLPLPEPTPGHIVGDVYESEWLGVVARIPAGMRARTGVDGMDLVIDRPDEGVAGGMMVSTRVCSPEQNEKTFREVHESLARALGELGHTVVRIGSGPTTTPLGTGIVRVWAVPNTAVQLRAILVPICAMTGSIVFVTMHSDEYAGQVLDGWLGSFRFRHGRNLKACDFLDPK